MARNLLWATFGRQTLTSKFQHVTFCTTFGELLSTDCFPRITFYRLLSTDNFRLPLRQVFWQLLKNSNFTYEMIHIQGETATDGGFKKHRARMPVASDPSVINHASISLENLFFSLAKKPDATGAESCPQKVTQLTKATYSKPSPKTPLLFQMQAMNYTNLPSFDIILLFNASTRQKTGNCDLNVI